MARHIFEVAATRLAAYAATTANRYPLRSEVRLASVRVWETATSWAEYQAD
jgi:6-pyruvoyltetrahydropterin/6-carboxytetrahydropterin synthase